MEIVLLGNIGFNNGAYALMEICEYLEQILELFVDSPYQICHLVFLRVSMTCHLETVLQELSHID